MANPAGFIAEYDAPFNFGMTVADWDVLYHDPKFFDILKPEQDPCVWTDEEKADVDRRATEWMDKWNEWCRRQADLSS